MAIFSMYTGALYNEFFSIAMQAFGRQHFVCPTNPALDNPVAMHFDHASCPEAFQQVRTVVINIYTQTPVDMHVHVHDE